MIIGICGFIGSGKDTIADYLVNIHEFRRDSWANSLKDAVSDVFGWDRELLEGRTRQSREWRETVDPWWSQRLDMPKLTPRSILQLWGTEVCRQHFHDDIWVASVENKLRRTTDDIVISDCRFPNEIAAIRRVGGRVIWVRRDPLPEWYECALETLAAKDLVYMMERHGRGMRQQYPEVHASEWAWLDTEFDLVIENNGTMDQLYARVNDLVQDLQHAKVNPAG